MADGADESLARAEALLRLFHPPEESFATIRAAESGDVVEPYRSLLDHRSHMTVAMDRHHGGAVGLRVVTVCDPGDGGAEYAREILLERSPGEVVLYGIVRIDLRTVDGATASAIRAARIPLGRLLIEAGFLRDVHHVSLLHVIPGRGLSGLFGRVHAGATFGRVADISLSGRPAVELLEVAAPPRS
jgi:hypothetical protein